MLKPDFMSSEDSATEMKRRLMKVGVEVMMKFQGENQQKTLDMP